jgi:hypothetical protein
MTQRSFVSSPPVSSAAVLVHTRLNLGWVRCGRHTFISDALVHLRDKLQRRARVDVVFEPNHADRAWVFDPDRHVWLEASNLYPRRSDPPDTPEASVS